MSVTCAPFFSRRRWLLRYHVKLQREVIAHPHHHFIEGQLAFAVARR
jgi:hypothetical protein